MPTAASRASCIQPQQCHVLGWTTLSQQPRLDAWHLAQRHLVAPRDALSQPQRHHQQQRDTDKIVC